MPPAGTESEHQSTFFQWVRLRALTDERFKNILSMPNGFQASDNNTPREKGKAIARVRKMIREGMEPGFPDILVLVPQEQTCRELVREDTGYDKDEYTRVSTTRYPGLIIETKAPYRRKQKNGGVEEKQQEWLERLSRYGYRTAVCYGVDELIDTVCAYLGVTKDG